MKKLLLILTFLITAFAGVLFVNAKNRPYNSSLVNDCVNDRSCILVCAYENSWNINSETTETSSAYIYYHDTGSWEVVWYGLETEDNLAKNSVLEKNSFPKKDVFIDKKDKLVKNGVCPKNGYVDSDKMNGANEICFDSDTKYCTKKDPGGAFTKFAGKTTKKYDVTSDFSKYLNNWSPTIPSCEALRNNNTNFGEQLTKDISTNFLGGKNLPTWMSNNSSYKNVFDSLKVKTETLKTECDNQVKADLAAGNITQSEANELLNQNQQGLSDINKDIEDAKENIIAGSGDINNDGYDTCEGVLSPDFIDALNGIFLIIKILVPILLIVLTMVDFLKVSALGDAPELKASFKKFMKRAIVAAVIFLLPTLVNFVLDIGGFTSGTCEIK